MSVLILLLIASICIAGAFLAAFLWSVRTGQYEDEFSPPHRILFDNDPIITTETTVDIIEK
jgi:cbb3-type cytochrome oxidase maturation protein